MAKKNLWLGILVMVLVFGMTVVGCDPDPKEKDNYEYKPSLFGIVKIDNVRPFIGETLTASFVGSGADGTATWQWIRGESTIISGANSNIYVVVAADAGQRLKAQVSYSGSDGVESRTTYPVIGIPSTANVSVSIETTFSPQYLSNHDVTVYLTLSDGLWVFPNVAPNGMNYFDLSPNGNTARTWITMSGTPNVNYQGYSQGQWSTGIASIVDRQKLRFEYTMSSGSPVAVSISNLTATLDTTKLTQMKGFTNVTGTLNAGSTTASSSVWVTGN